MSQSTSISVTSTTLAIAGGSKAVTAFEAQPKPKIGKAEFLAIAQRFGFKPDALERLTAAVSDADLEGHGPNLAKYSTAFPASSSGSRYEEADRELFGVPFALGVSSGTGALHAAMVAAGAAPGPAVRSR